MKYEKSKHVTKQATKQEKRIWDDRGSKTYLNEFN